MLYFASMPVAQPANIFIHLFVTNNNSINFVKPCNYKVIEYNNKPVGIKYTDKTPYVVETEEKFNSNFRAVDWTKNTDFLTKMLEKYNPKSLWYASFYPRQLEVVKSALENVITIAFNYNKKDYSFIKRKCLELGYTDNIPASVNVSADIEINLIDLYNKEKTYKMFNELNAVIDNDAWDLYNKITE